MKSHTHFSVSPALLSAGLCMILSLTVQASDELSAEEIADITSNWVCKWCPYPKQSKIDAEVSAGVGYVTNDSYKQGDYTGLDEEGAYPIAGFAADYRAPGQTQISVSGNELGTDARDLSLAGRSGGKFSGKLGYSEIPHLTSDTARTPYNGSTHQQLPAGWTTAVSTQAMPQLASSLHDVDTYTNRKTFSVAASFQQNANLSYELSFQRDSKEGKRAAGLALGRSFSEARAVILAIPVDYQTNQGEIKVNFVQDRLYTSLAYQFSKFDNSHNSVRWDNAFSGIDTPVPPPQTLPPVTEGQAALEPDNSMHKFVFNGLYRIDPVSSGKLLIAYGQMKQNESFLPYTVNTDLSPFDLPVSSLDGKISTFDAVLAYYKKFTEQFKLEAKYQHNEQENETKRNAYDYVIADHDYSASPRANFPYSFRKYQLEVLGSYQVPNHGVTIGATSQVHDRTYQSVETTTENILKASYRSDVVENTDIRVRGELSKREGDEYQIVTEVIQPDNPLMRKYNQADRDRNRLGIMFNYAPGNTWQLSAYFDAYKDLYDNSELGLLESIQKDYGVSLLYPVNQDISFNVDYTLTAIESTQAGSSTVDWRAVNDDQIDTLYLGIDYKIIPEKLSLGLEYGYADAEGKIKVSTGEPLPRLTSTRHTILVYGDYKLDKMSTINAFYRYEDYDESDWAVDGVNPDTIASVLSLGEVSPSYQIGILGVSFNYQF